MSKKWDNDIDEDNRIPEHIVRENNRKAIFDAAGEEMMEELEWGELGGAND